MCKSYHIVAAGENAILVYFGTEINATLPEKIGQFAKHIKTTLNDIVVDVIPSYTSLHISYDLNKITYQAFVDKAELILS